MVLSAECDDFMRKPFRAEEMFEKMAQHIGVRYTYKEEERQDTADLPSLIPLRRGSKLHPSSLQIMPHQWLEHLQLMAQIPDTHAPLATALLAQANNFDFDDIFNLAQAAIAL